MKRQFFSHTFLQMKWQEISMAYKRVAKPRFFLFIMVIAVAVFSCSYFFEGRYIKVQEKRIAELDGIREAAALANGELERKIIFTETDEYIERVAREELSLLKPGQIRFVRAGQ